MVTLSVERTPAISTVRGKRSPGCGNYATRRRIQSSTISRTISRWQMQAASAWVAYGEGKKDEAIEMLAEARTRKMF